VRRSGLQFDPDRFWVAEYGRALIGFGLAIRRRSLWYLAALHILPEHQSHGIGGELLRRCLGDPNTLPPSLLTISESINLVSTALYARWGMFPQVAIVQLEGTPVSLGSGHLTLRLAVSPAELDRFDLRVLGEIRPEDHQCWRSVDGVEPYLVLEGNHTVGYIYVDSAGALGPAAVERSDLLCPTISAALEMLQAKASRVARLRLPGTARETFAALLSAGFRIDTGVNLFLTSRQFGHLDQYLFSGADALF
jgi:hypothetical protein